MDKPSFETLVQDSQTLVAEAYSKHSADLEALETLDIEFVSARMNDRFLKLLQRHRREQPTLKSDNPVAAKEKDLLTLLRGPYPNQRVLHELVILKLIHHHSRETGSQNPPPYLTRSFTGIIARIIAQEWGYIMEIPDTHISYFLNRSELLARLKQIANAQGTADEIPSHLDRFLSQLILLLKVRCADKSVTIRA
ncbi:hypothetical protein HN748_05135 [Candidatus Peregrinibacteria bacterium]|jgi:hypothetical protein|nr:hypothetical protein [Candidatus Peregrinibacteria bacterium]MBT7483236.1 hypothetical protein [Candidatus Peregrinibacteria bacterium]MBT7703594.1 hypothetical protein [Candidatus Peregrinibacteria bacterium]